MATCTITKYAGGFRFRFTGLGSLTKNIAVIVGNKRFDGTTSNTSYNVYAGYDDDIDIKLSPNTSYYYKYYVDLGSAAAGHITDEGYISTTNLYTPDVSVDDITQNSAKISIDASDTNTNYYRFSLTVNGTTYYYPNKTGLDDADSCTFSINGLSAGTTYSYSVNAAFYHADDTDSYLGVTQFSGSFTTEAASTPVSWLTIKCNGFEIDTDNFMSLDNDKVFCYGNGSSGSRTTVTQLDSSTTTELRYKIEANNTNSSQRVYVNMPNNLQGCKFTYKFTQGTQVNITNQLTSANDFYVSAHPTDGMLVNEKITKGNGDDQYFYLFIYPGSQIILELTATPLETRNLTVFNPFYNVGSTFSLSGDLHSGTETKEIATSQTSWYVGETVTLTSTAIPETLRENEYEWDGIYSANASGSLNSRLTTNRNLAITFYAGTNATTYYSLQIDHYERCYINAAIPASMLGISVNVSPSGYVRKGSSVTFTATLSSGYEFVAWKESNNDGTGTYTQMSTRNPYTWTVTRALTLYGFARTSVAIPDAYWWTYHSCNINNGNPLAVSATGKLGYKWNQATAQSAATADKKPEYAQYYGGYLTAVEWNGLLDKINEWEADYAQITETDFTQAVRGRALTAAMYNQAADAINNMMEDDNHYISRVKAGDELTAQSLNKLIEQLNNLDNL